MFLQFFIATVCCVQRWPGFLGRHNHTGRPKFEQFSPIRRSRQVAACSMPLAIRRRGRWTKVREWERDFQKVLLELPLPPVQRVLVGRCGCQAGPEDGGMGESRTKRMWMPSKTMKRLSTCFNSGDTLLLRTLPHSGAGAPGWGWCDQIDLNHPWCWSSTSITNDTIILTWFTRTMPPSNDTMMQSPEHKTTLNWQRVWVGEILQYFSSPGLKKGKCLFIQFN